MSAERPPAGGEMHPFPHLKIPLENFPRVLATRRLSEDGGEYFGPFPNRTATRILIDFVNRVFRLRSCTIAVDGSFFVPCTQYFARRCIAPCVASLCSPTAYASRLRLAAAFLRNDAAAFFAESTKQIATASESLDFELAAGLRDLAAAVADYWSDSRRRVWIDDAADTFDFDARAEPKKVFYVSQRGRRTIARYAFTLGDGGDAGSLGTLIEKLYQYGAPREIRVTRDFGRRRQIAKTLSERFGRAIPVKVVSEERRTLTASRGVGRARYENEQRELHQTISLGAAGRRVAELFDLPSVPRIIEAYDAAHISSTQFTAAAVRRVLRGETFDTEIAYELSEKTSEPAALGSFAARNLARKQLPDFILVDGGRTQLNALSLAIPNAGPPVVGAVKPPGRHSQISHFLTLSGKKIAFDAADPAHRFLISLRDEVHQLANTVHRLRRDMSAFYEIASALPSVSAATRNRLIKRFGTIKRITKQDEAVLAEAVGRAESARAAADLENFRKGFAKAVEPLIVPLRLDEAGGGAEDLIPILTGPKKLGR